MLLTLRNHFLWIFVVITTSLQAQVEVDSNHVFYKQVDEDCWPTEVDLKFPSFKDHDGRSLNVINDSIARFFETHCSLSDGNNKHYVDSIIDLRGEHDLTISLMHTLCPDEGIRPEYTGTSFEVSINTSELLCFTISVSRHAGGVGNGADFMIGSFMYDTNRNCWLNRDSIFIPGGDSLLLDKSDKDWEVIGDGSYTGMIGLKHDKIVFYYLADYGHAAEMLPREISYAEAEQYIRKPYRQLLKSLERTE